MPITAEEREAALHYLISSREHLHVLVADFSPERWHFRPADSWSPALVVEHVYFIETVALRDIMQAPPSPETKPRHDQRVLRLTVDRSTKLEVPKALIPQGRTTEPAELLRKFDAARERSLAWLNNPAVDHRAHAMLHPFLKVLDGYQWLLFFAAHCERHIAQIEELKARPDFPGVTNRAGSSVPG